LVKAKARLRLGGAQQTTIKYDGVKPTLKSVSKDVFSTKENTTP